MNKRQNIAVYLTSKDFGSRIEKLAEGDLSTKSKNSLQKIRVSKNSKRQTIMGFGGAFTEASASVYNQLNEEKKKEVMEAYFGQNGNEYNMGRTHINSCDFSLGNYAHCETEDVDLKNFSIERDKKMVIPFIKDAQNSAHEKIHIMASPWSPPSWMKTNGEMNNGGKLKKKFRNTWAKYYCMYIQFYEKEGIPIWGLSVQNEPEAVQTWDSCIYTGDEERDFIKNFLGPALDNNNLLDKKLIIWDHNRDIMLERARAVLSDPEAAKYVWGTGFHWYNGNHFEEVQKVHDEFPDKELIFTEGCQEGGPHKGSWDLGERYATSIINDLNRWTVAWIDWNLILNEQGGPNHVGNYCSAPILIDTAAQKIQYQSSFYYIGHFSRFIKRGDVIIDCQNDTEELLALSSINKSEDIVTVIMNKHDSEIQFCYDNSLEIKPLSMPARSIITIVDSH